MKIKLSGVERDTILAALRLYQLNMHNLPLPIFDIATNDGKHDSLNVDEVDGLCERINK